MGLSAADRSAGLAAAARVARLELIAAAEAVAGETQVEVVGPPAAATLLVELDTPVGSFGLTEMVVTTCEVTVDGSAGWAAVTGWDDEASLAAAILDARPAAAERVARGALAIEADARAVESAAVAATRVER